MHSVGHNFAATLSCDMLQRLFACFQVAWHSKWRTARNGMQQEHEERTGTMVDGNQCSLARSFRSCGMGGTLPNDIQRLHSFVGLKRIANDD